MKKSKLLTAVLSLALVSALALPALAANTQQTNVGEPMVISPAPASSGYTIEVNGKTTDIDPTIMVPLRAIAEQLGFKVTWNNGSVLVDNGTMHSEVTIGEDSYYVATSVKDMIGMSAPFSLGAAPYVTNGVTYVPLELFRTLLGNGDDVITVDGGTIRITTTSGDNTQIPNPFVDCSTLEEAAKLAGFTMTAPAKVDGYTGRDIQAIEDQMIQVFYKKADDQTLMLRKAVGAEDISGDYTVYTETNAVVVGTLTVTMKGNNGMVSVATWVDGGYTYAVGAQDVPMSASAVKALIASIH